MHYAPNFVSTGDLVQRKVVLGGVDELEVLGGVVLIRLLHIVD